MASVKIGGSDSSATSLNNDMSQTSDDAFPMLSAVNVLCDTVLAVRLDIPNGKAEGNWR